MKRRVTICREGWYYLMVLTFIISGAVLRQINLLILLAGLMTGPLLLNWRLVSATLRRFRVKREVPDHASAGAPFLIGVVATNDRLRLSSWAVAVQDNIQLANAAPDYRTKVEVMIPYVAAQESGRTDYRCVLSRRGKYKLGPMRISTRFPLGLVRASVVTRQQEELIVWPRVGRLTQRWTRIVEAGPLGDRHSIHRQGLMENGEYYGVREWRPGDSKRWIHWRTSAKVGNLAVREFEQQRNRALAIVLDLWQPDDPTAEQLGNAELAVSFVATIVADSCRQGGKHLAVALSGRGREFQAGTSSDMLMRDLLGRLSVFEAGGSDEFSSVLGDVVDDVESGARLIVVSTRCADLVDVGGGQPEPWREAALRQLTWFDVSNDEHAGVFQWRDE